MAGEGLSFVYKNILMNNDFNNSKAPLQNKTSTNWVFGKPGERDLEGAKEVMSGWRFHTPSRLQSRQKDFRSINKKSVKRGLSTSKDFRMAQKTETLYTNHNEGSASTSFVLPEDEFIFGQPNRPSTPLNEVLGNLYNAHAYGAQSAVTNQEIYKARLQEVQRKGNFLPRVSQRPVQPITVNPIKRQDIDELTKDIRVFKLKKYENVKPKVSTANKEYVAPRPSAKGAHMRSSSCGASRIMRNI